MSWSLAGRPLRRVLVTRLRYLGDVVLASVVADLLKAGDPALEVGFLCEAGHGPVLAGHASVDRIHLLDAGRRGADVRARVPSRVGRGRGTLGMVDELRRERYDLAVDLFFNPRSAWLLWLARIPLRIGGTAGGRRRLYTHNLPRHEVADPTGVLDRRLPGTLGAHGCRLAPLRHGPQETPFLEWLEARPQTAPWQPRLPRHLPGERVGELLAAAGIGGQYAVAAPAATWPSKEWPADHWRELLAGLPARLGRPVAVLVPPGREPVWLPASVPKGLVALPPLDLPEVLEVLGGADLLVSVDGGVMHAAVGMGVPTLALFGPTDPEIWFPYAGGGIHRVLATRPDCHPCNLLECNEFVCLPDLDPTVVATAAAALCARAGASGWEPASRPPCST